MRIPRAYFQVAAEVGQAIMFLLYSRKIFDRIRLLNTEMESNRHSDFLIFSMEQLILNDVPMKHWFHGGEADMNLSSLTDLDLSYGYGLHEWYVSNRSALL